MYCGLTGNLELTLAVPTRDHFLASDWSVVTLLFSHWLKLKPCSSLMPARSSMSHFTNRGCVDNKDTNIQHIVLANSPIHEKSVKSWIFERPSRVLNMLWRRCEMWCEFLTNYYQRLKGNFLLGSIWYPWYFVILQKTYFVYIDWIINSKIWYVGNWFRIIS